MTDAKSLKDLGIPLRIDGSTRFVKGATKYTTCADVIKMVLKKTGIHKDYRPLFSIFEVTKDGERALSCKTRIVGEMKKWTDNGNRFALRKIDPIGERLLKDNECNGKTKVVRVITSDKRVQIESSETDSSDTSFEEFLAKVDQNKLANLMKLFKAMASGEANKLTKQCETPAKTAPTVPPKKPQTGTKVNQRNAGQVFTRRKIRQSRRSRSASKLQDRHPNKIHRVDYGFVDRVPQQCERSRVANVTSRDDFGAPKRVPTFDQDSVTDFLNAHDSMETKRNQYKEDKAKLKKGARRMLPFAKFLMPGKRKVDDLATKGKSKTRNEGDNPRDERTSSANLDNDFRRAVGGRFEVVGDCREIWDNSKMRREVYSGHDDSSDISSQPCPTSSPTHSTHSSSSDMSICADRQGFEYNSRPVDSDGHGLLNNNQIPPEHHACLDNDISHTRLVDYSISSVEDYDELDRTSDDDDDEDGDVLNSRISSDDDSSNYFSNSNGGGGGSPRSDDVMGVCDVTSFIKGVFGKTCDACEDDEMDSFMKSKIYEDSSDEGVSSLESGLDHEHL